MVAIVENFDSLLYAGPGRKRGTREGPQWALRNLLMSHSALMLVAAAPTLFGEIRDSDAPFYDFFREHHLDELSMDDMVHLIRSRLEAELRNENQDERVLRRLRTLKADFAPSGTRAAGLTRSGGRIASVRPPLV